MHKKLEVAIKELNKVTNMLRGLKDEDIKRDKVLGEEEKVEGEPKPEVEMK